jgi:hypothetical protein
MEEFSALAARVAASVGDLRGVLILSRDGLVLGAFPEGDEAALKPAWLRFAALGEPDKGFAEFADELWAYVRRGPYASFAVAGPKVRPGLLMDQLEQMLMAAEEVRARREALRLPDAAPAPSGKPRTSLHSERPQPAPTPPVAPAQAAAAPSRPAPPPAAAPPSRPGVPVGGAYTPPPSSAPRPPQGSAPPAGRPPNVSGPSSAPSPAPGPAGGPERTFPPPQERPAEPAPARAPEEEGEVDPVLLAQEFSRLLQETGEGDET